MARPQVSLPEGKPAYMVKRSRTSAYDQNFHENDATINFGFHAVT